LEKLHLYFKKQGVSSTTGIIAGELSAHSIHAAPMTLAGSVTAVALAKGAAVSGSTLSLIKGTMKIMAWAKMKMTFAVGMGALLLAVGTTLVTVGQTSKSVTDDSWRDLSHFMSQSAMEADLAATPPQVTILPTIHPDWGSMWWADRTGRMLGMNSSLTNLLMDAYGIRNTHMIFPGPMAGGKYDFIANLPQGSDTALQAKIKELFGVVGHKAVLDTPVWVLRAGDPDKLNASVSKKKSPHQESKYVDGKTLVVMEDESAAKLASALEGWLLQAPVLDRTGRAGRYDLNLSWDHSDKPKSTAALIDQLHQAGFELVASREKLEMLTVENVK